MFRNNIKTWPQAARRLWIAGMVIEATATIVGIVVVIKHLLIPGLFGTLAILMLIAVGCLTSAIGRKESKQAMDQENHGQKKR